MLGIAENVKKSSGCLTSNPVGASTSMFRSKLELLKKPNILSTMSESLTGSCFSLSICSSSSFFRRASSRSACLLSSCSRCSSARRSWCFLSASARALSAVICFLSCSSSARRCLSASSLCSLCAHAKVHIDRCTQTLSEREKNKARARRTSAQRFS